MGRLHLAQRWLCMLGEGDAVGDGGTNSVEFAIVFARVFWSLSFLITFVVSCCL